MELFERFTALIEILGSLKGSGETFPATTYMTFGDFTSNLWSLNPAAFIIKVLRSYQHGVAFFRCFVRNLFSYANVRHEVTVSYLAKVG